ncbi:MAG: squalene synthase HpnC [Burkholderiales bacterium]|nr:squalene synthase HpnC [Burkholderiales bacterium]
MGVGHYENFPVASLLLPARLRLPIAAIYRFARGADDLADEGDASDAERLTALAGWREQLRRVARGDAPAAEPDAEGFAVLGRVIAAHDLPVRLLEDLLDAFAQDVVKKRYRDARELADYCARSANPVGRLLLHLYGRTDALSLTQSDAICSALQLINFYQDVGIDWDKGRVYLPQDQLVRFGVTEDLLAKGDRSAPFIALMASECARAREMMLFGAPLALRLGGRAGWELRLVTQGGLRILERIAGVDYDVFQRRPTLGARDWLLMAWRALGMR